MYKKPWEQMTKANLFRRAACSLVAVWPLCAAEAVPTVLFNRDIRPILSDKCFTCHGPDAPSRNIKLRLDSEAGAKADLGGRFAIVAGDPARSELARRITAENKGLRMPPVASGFKLSDREIDLLRRCIEQGAQWQQHWSFIPPKRPALPAVKQAGWPRNPIDHFVLARLEQEGLSPSPEAGRETLLRRVSLDLTGLPPSIEEIDAFLNDTSPAAYEKVVDRLLASPRYGERMAFPWLEAARYADTNGYQTDAERYMWRWRDWVIEAFNSNMPFDRFVVEQIAGDLLHNATLDQKIATGFHRNHRDNGEGGIIPEEYAVEYVADRVETTGTVFLGLTVACTRCHNHKYDPLTQKEFYQLFAYFNNINERGRYFKYGNTPPVIHAPTREQQARLAELDSRLGTAEGRFESLRAAARSAQSAWEKSLASGNGRADWTPERGLAARFHLDDPVFDGKRVYVGGDAASFGFNDKFTLAAWVYPEDLQSGAILTRTKDVSEETGYGLWLAGGKVQATFVQRWLDDALRVETVEPLAPGQWSHVAVSYDGSLVADGVRIYINGRAAKLKILLDDLNQDFRLKEEPFRIGGGGGPEHRFRGRIDQVSAYSEVLPPELVAVLAARDDLNAIAALAPDKRTEAQRVKLRLAYLESHAPDAVRSAWRELVEARRARAAYLDTIPTLMVMEEMPAPKPAFLLTRGQYDKPGEPVQRGVPAVLPPLPAGVPNNRLGLARWLVDPSNPLTARVAVNRFWQMYFGNGLVRTVEDFGSQGEWPSHMDLLDWLAVEFMDSGWDVKALQKKIVMSATYRQDSRVTPDLLRRDPETRLLARGPRSRLSASVIRDQALAASGLLVEKIGGPSVKPYQPSGLWKELSGGGDYNQDHGEKLYRRSLYTFWKRAAPPPFMMNFDAAGREICVVRQSRTNTPLQALNLMNDVTYLEAARVLAQRVMRQAGPSPDDRITRAFRLVTTRKPSTPEMEVLRAAFHHHLDGFRSDPAAARRYLAHGESPVDESVPAPELAAYATVAGMILNLDEAVTKE